MIGVVGSLAEFEQELVKERTPLKPVTSRANGRKFGRHRKVDDTEHIATAKRMKADGHTAKDIAKYLGVSRTVTSATAFLRPARRPPVGLLGVRRAGDTPREFA
jgi:DNA invertase Pin-like site-specific DNA recombinase